MLLLFTDQHFFCGVAVGWFLFAWCSGGCCTGGRLAPARGRGPEALRRAQKNGRTHFNSKTGFSIIDFKMQSDLAGSRLGDIAQLVDPYNNNGTVSACLACGRS